MPRRGMPRAERERQLLDIGERAFAERGYNGVSMEEIASEAGITKPLIYDYFGSKEGFLVAGIQRAYERAIERVEGAAAAGGPPDELLWRMNLAVFAWLEDYRELMPLVYGSQALGGSIAVEGAKARGGVVALVARILGELIPDPAVAGEVEPLAEAAVAVNMALGDRWVRHPEESRELQALRATNIIWPALERLIEGRPWMPPGSAAAS